MGMHVFSYLRQTLRRKDKSRDADWDFGARQSTPVDETVTRSDSTSSTKPNSTNPRLRRSASLDGQRRSSLAPEKQTDAPQHQHGQQNSSKRVSAAVGSSSTGSSDVYGSQAHENRQLKSDIRVSTSGPRSGSPEDDVLLAAGETAKEIRTSGKPADARRRIHSIAVAPRLDSTGRRHTPSPLTTRDGIPIPSSPTSRSLAGSPTPSVQSFHSVQTGTNDATRRAALLAKRSMPQLHNVWENFLEEAAEEADSFSFPLPPQPGKYATVHPSSHTNSGNQSLRHHHSPTSSSSSTSTATTAASVSTVRTVPRIPTSDSLLQSPSATRERGHLRNSHHTTSSTSSTTTSTHGSTSSMAAFSSASSMTTAHDDCCDDSPQVSDDPVPPTPRSSAGTSPKSFKFADPSLKPMVQRLRKSPTSPSLQCQALQRGVSPTSSSSGESYVSSMSSCSHSQSTTPTPSSVCPTPSPTPFSGPAPKSAAGNYVGRLSPVNSRMSGQYRRTPEVDLSEQPLSPGSMKHRKSSTNSPRYSSLSGRSQVELKLFPSPEDGEEDVVSELGNYNSGALRTRNQQQRQSIQSVTFSTASTSPSSPTPSSSPVIPPIRRGSRQHLRTVVAQSVDALTIPRAKSASNIKHEALERQRLTAVHSSSPLQATKDGAIQVAAISASSGAPVYLRESRSQSRLHSRPLNHTRAQTLQHSPAQMQVIVDANSSGTTSPGAHVHAGSSSPSFPSAFPSASASVSVSSSRPGQGRLRSGSASVVYSHNPTLTPPKSPPVRPPPAPPLDMTPARLRPPVTASASRGGSSNSSSPLTPASAVQWGYAL